MFGHGPHHHHQPPPPAGPHGGGYPPAPPQQEPTFKIFCRADEGFCLTVRNDAVVLAPTNPRDPYQHWYKDMRHSTRVKDDEGHPAFALVNRATGLAIKHSLGQSHPVKLVPYNPEYLEESVLWTESKDVGKGFRCIRMVNNTRLNFDAFHGDKDHGGVHDGTTVVLWEWCKGPNQSWKILPWGDEAYAPPPPAYGGAGYGYPGGSQAGAYPPLAQEPGYGYRPPTESYAPPPAQEPGYGYRPPPGGPGSYAPPPAHEPGYGYRPPPGGAEGYAPPPGSVPGYGYSNLPRELASQSTVRIYCKAGEDYSLTVRNGTVCLAPTNPRDDYQHWVKDMRHSTSIKDEEGYPAFALVNKVTGEAIKHSLGQSHPIRLVPYNPEYEDESVLWTESRDVGHGFRCVRMVNNIYLNFDAFHGDKDHGGVHDGTTVVLWEWAKGDNQSWKILPWGDEAYAAAGGNASRGGEPTVRIYCKADEGFSVTVRHGTVCLAPTNPRDEYQHWIKDMRHSNSIKDEEGYPAFALVNKVTGEAIKHSQGEGHPVKLVPYNPGYQDESVLWTESRDVGHGFRCIRMVNNIYLNFDAFHGDKDHGGVRDGTNIVLWKWCEGDNQRWKIVPW